MTVTDKMPIFHCLLYKNSRLIINILSFGLGSFQISLFFFSLIFFSCSFPSPFLIFSICIFFCFCLRLLWNMNLGSRLLIRSSSKLKYYSFLIVVLHPCDGYLFHHQHIQLQALKSKLGVGLIQHLNHHFDRIDFNH